MASPRVPSRDSWPDELLHVSDAAVCAQIARYERLNAPSASIMQKRAFEQGHLPESRTPVMSWSPVTNFCVTADALRRARRGDALASLRDAVPRSAIACDRAPDRPRCLRDVPPSTFLNPTRGA